MSTLGSQLLTDTASGDGKSISALPTALAVSSKFIAVGNQIGEIWVFDLFEMLKNVLGGVKDGSESSVLREAVM